MNRPLSTSCPCCSGTGKVSWLRSGAWINEHCPGRNGPCDVDNSTSTHELDNYHAKRKARIEYKRPGEPVPAGQEYHVRAELESTREDWKNVLVIIRDDGQLDGGDEIEFSWRVSGSSFVTWDDLRWHKDTVENLGRRIAKFLWPTTV
jgi:hypothetical protein